MASEYVATLYSRTGALASSTSTESISNSDPNSGHTTILSPQSSMHRPPPQRQRQKHRFPPPSFLQRAYLSGFLYKPRDLVFLLSLISSAVYAMLRLHCLELPFLILTRFRYTSTKQHPLGWTWWWTIIIALTRVVGLKVRTIGQLRFIGFFLETFLPLQSLLVRGVKVEKNIQFKVHLETLLRPERASLEELRRELQRMGLSDEVMNPSQEYLESMHRPASATTGLSHSRLSNIPDEVGRLDHEIDGAYTLRGEWIEALSDNRIDTRPLSKTVVLYFHGGGHGFLSPASHRDFLCRLAKDIGPGTRIFSVDYRMGPEHPFPAAIHDAFAAYLYLTEPTHEALILDHDDSDDNRDQDMDKKKKRHVPVNPRDIVVAGDSAGGNLATAFMLYLAKYVQPSIASPKYVMPHATVLISAWTDPTSSLPAANNNDWYCYCPGPIGTHPLDKQAYMDFRKMHYASNYLCGDVTTCPNARNALGKEREWEWYTHLAQHPLVSPVHRAELSGLTNTLLHTATHDRLIDDSRLYAHRLGLESPDQLVRIEVYKNMVHVHHVFSILESARLASRNIARFIDRSRHQRDAQQEQTRDGVESAQGILSKAFNGVEQKYTSSGMVKKKVAQDNVEWVMVDHLGKEEAKDEGWPMSILVRTWPPNEASEK